MNIVWQEMKKIVSVKKLLYLAGFYVLYFVLFLKTYVQSPYAESYHEEADYVKSLMEEYGAELSREEFEELKSRAPEYNYDEIDEYIASSQEFKELEIHDFLEFMDSAGGMGLSLDEENSLWFMIYDEFPAFDVSKKMEDLITYEVWRYYIAAYEQETAGGTIYYESLNEAQKKRVQERGEKEVYGMVPQNVIGYNFEVLRFTGAFMALGMMFMIMPYMVAENRIRMPSLQYSFKKGRSCYEGRLTAVLLSCVLIAVLTAAGYGRIAVMNRVTDFWKCSVSSFSTGFISWLPLTLGQYTVLHFVIAAAFSIGFSLVIFAVTHYLENYVTAIAWLLPAMVGGIFFCGFVMYAFDEITGPKGAVILAGSAVLGLGLLAVVIQGVREKRRDIKLF